MLGSQRALSCRQLVFRSCLTNYVGVSRCFVRRQHDLHKPSNGSQDNRSNINTTLAGSTSHDRHQDGGANTRSESSVPQPVFRNRRIPLSAYKTLTAIVGLIAGVTIGTVLSSHERPATTNASFKSDHGNRLRKECRASDLVKSFRENSWIEEDPASQCHDLASSTKDMNSASEKYLVNDTLAGDGSLVKFYFRHPNDWVTVVIFIADPNCQRDSDCGIHEGIIASMVDEGLNIHTKRLPSHKLHDQKVLHMNRHQSIVPGTVYTLLLQSELVEFPFPAEEDRPLLAHGVKMHLMKASVAPRITDRRQGYIGPTTNIAERIFDIDPQSDAYADGTATIFLLSQKARQQIREKNEIRGQEIQNIIDQWTTMFMKGKRAQQESSHV